MPPRTLGDPVIIALRWAMLRVLQTDRQTESQNIDTIYGWVGIFFLYRSEVTGLARLGRCPVTTLKIKNFSPFYFASPEIIWVEFCDRQTDRQTESQNIDTIYGWVCVFFSSQNFLPPYSLRSQGDYNIKPKCVGVTLRCIGLKKLIQSIIPLRAKRVGR